jgi:hypothetical protein
VARAFVDEKQEVEAELATRMTQLLVDIRPLGVGPA